MTARENLQFVAQSQVRADGIDLVRGLAIFLVLMNHVHMRLFLAGVPYTSGLAEQLVSTMVWNGQRGVQIFFTVSGFLITSMSLRRWGSLRAVDIPGFYRLRFARIAPPLFALLILLSVLHWAGVPNYVVSERTGGLGRALLAALTFHVNLLESSRGYLPANWDILWSLSVEEVFYLGFPLICAFLPSRAITAVLVIFVIVGPVERAVWAAGNPVWREYSFLAGMDAIALGCLAARYVHGARNTASATGRIMAGAGLAIVAVSLGLSESLRPIAKWGLDMTLLAVGTGLILIPAQLSGWQTPRVLQPVALMGRYSYEIYLTHMLVVFSTFGLWRQYLNSSLPVPVLFAASIGASVLLGAVVGRVYSEPMNLKLRR